MKKTRYTSQTFVTVPNKCSMAKLSASAQAVYFWLVAYDFEFENTTPSRKSLAKLSGVKSQATISRVLDELESLGLITITSRKKKNGGDATNQYEINIVDTEPCRLKDLQGGVQIMNTGGSINEHEHNNYISNKGTNVPADAGPSPKEKEKTSPTMKKLVYDVVRKYDLPTRNNAHLQARIKQFEESPNPDVAREYLNLLLELDYETLTGDYKPELSTGLDIRDKSKQIMRWLKDNKHSVDKSKYVNL